MCRLQDRSSIAKPRHPFLASLEFWVWYLVHVLVRLWYPNKPHEWVQVVHSVKSDHFEPKTIKWIIERIFHLWLDNIIQFVKHEISILPFSIFVFSIFISSITESSALIDDVVVSKFTEAPIVATVSFFPSVTV